MDDAPKIKKEGRLGSSSANIFENKKIYMLRKHHMIKSLHMAHRKHGRYYTVPKTANAAFRKFLPSKNENGHIIAFR